MSLAVSVERDGRAVRPPSVRDGDGLEYANARPESLVDRRPGGPRCDERLSENLLDIGAEGRMAGAITTETHAGEHDARQEDEATYHRHHISVLMWRARRVGRLDNHGFGGLRLRTARERDATRSP